MRPHRALLAALGLTLAAGVQAKETLTEDDLVLNLDALPTTALSSEAAQRYNVTPADDRGLLTITVLKKKADNQTRNMPAQIYAGALTQQNYLISIPIREVQDKEGVYYLGEFHVTPKQTLTFLVNVNVQGRPFKAKFSQPF